ncbi:hypothetical protein B0H19DRAFT_1263975 [Mycena capillaripes]|nr:hypothetical protein B0H19DRAFT_1263975 [Mycena capillaripes]
MLSSILVIVPLITGVLSANDWNTPCVDVHSIADLPTTIDGPSGTLKIWGSENAITDITPAADWQILDCNQTELSQNIRLVCMNDDDPSSLCGHLYQNTGPVNKIVRLPQNCGANAFARVANAWVPDDQSIPSSIKARLVRRDGNQPEVKALSIDTNFDAVDPSKTGEVNFAIQAANVPGTANDIQIPGSRRGRGSRRGSFLGISDFDKDKTFSFKPISFNKSVNLFNTSVDCGPTSASLSVDIDANATAEPILTLSVAGSLFRPKITSFQVVAGMTAHVFGGLSLSAELSGHVDSGVIPLLNIGIPGFDFPGVLTLGPSFQARSVFVIFVGDVELTMDLAVGINFDVNNAQLIFPPNSTAPDSNAFSIGDTPLSLSATPGVQATGTLTAHLIPSLNLGVTAFGGAGNANVFVALDTSAALVLNLDASAQIIEPIGSNSTQSDSVSDIGTIPSVLPSSTQSIETTSSLLSELTLSVPAVTITSSLSDSDATILPDSTHSSPTITITPSIDPSATTDTSSAFETSSIGGAAFFPKRAGPNISESFGGCVQVNGGINVNAGAEGDFFGLFDKAASVSLFAKNFQIFQKCFGDGASHAPAPTKRWTRRRVSAWDRQRRSLFSCPSPGLSAPESVADETVSSPSIAEA